MHKVTLIVFSALTALTLGTISASADRGTDNQHGPGTATNNISSVTTIGQGFISSGTDSASAASGHSTAEFQVAPGDLTLDQVPNLKMNDTKVSDIAHDDVTTSLLNNSTTQNTNYDGNNDGKLAVTDFTGTSNGWNVMTSLGQFKSTKTDATISDATLTLTAAKTESDGNVATPTTSSLNADATNDSGKSTQETNLWAAAKGTGQGSNTSYYNATSSAKLAIKKQSNIAPGTYQATLYWSLTNVPQAASAKI